MSLQPTEARRSVPRVNETEEDSQGTNLHEGKSVGDKCWKDKEGVIRLAFQNVQGLGFDRRSRKYKLIHNFVKKHSVDMIRMVETNTCWPKVGMSLSLFERTKEWC